MTTGISNALSLPKADLSGITIRNQIGLIDRIENIQATSLPFVLGSGLPQTFTQIQMEGYTSSHLAGLPALPVKTELIELPQGAMPEIRVTGAEYTDIDLKAAGYPFALFPAQEAIRKNAKEKIAFQYDSRIYATDNFIGAHGIVSDPDHPELVRLEYIGEMRGTRIGRLSLSPFFYNPATHTLRVYTKIDIDIDFPEADIAATSLKKERYASPFSPVLEKTLLNPLRLNRNTAKAKLPKQAIRYVIVSDPMFRDSLQAFVQWKTRLGFDVIQAYTDQAEVGKSLESIHAYLKGLYDGASEAEPAPDFVLFVGDTAQIPSKIYTYQEGEYITHQVSDLFLCDYTGDYLPEVQYGRMSANTVDELMPQLHKTMEMEGIRPDKAHFMDTTVLIAGVDNQGFGQSCLNPTVNYLRRYYFKDTLSRYCHFYPYPESGEHASDIIQNINDGTSFVIYTAHGDPDCWGDPYISNKDIANRFNNKGKYPFVVGNCCLTGKFDEPTCFGEALLRKKNGGAVAYIGASNSSYFYHDVYWAIGYTRVLMAGVEHTYEETGLGSNDALFHTHGEPYQDWALTAYEYMHAGNMAVLLANQGYEEYYWQIYHVFGDPSFMPYTQAPKEIEASYSSSLIVGERTYAVNTEPYARVVLSQGDKVLALAMADENGVAELDITGITESGTAVLGILAQNFSPLFDSIELIRPDSKYAILSTQTLSDENGDNVKSGLYASTYSVSYTIRNVGSELIRSVQMAMSSQDEYLEIGNGTFVLEKELAPGQEMAVEHSFQLTVNPDVPDRHTATYSMELVLDGENDSALSQEYKLTVNAPDLAMTGFHIDDSASSQPNGVIDHGETVTGILHIQNNGQAAAKDIQIAIASPDAPYLTFPEESIQAGTLEPGASKEVRFEYSAQESPVKYALYTLDFSISTLGREYKTQARSYIEPIVETFESGDFSFAPWNTAGSGWTIDQSRTHNGSYSAVSGKINDNESSVLSMEVDVPIDDRVGFYFWTSSELAQTVLGDFLLFRIDGTSMGRWAGISGNWTYVEFPVPAGKHLLEWSYAKDGSSAAGEDRVWIDDIRLPIGSIAAIGTGNESMEKEENGASIRVRHVSSNHLVLDFLFNARETGNLYIVDATGRKVSVLATGMEIPAGKESRTFHIGGLPAGLYICVFESAHGMHAAKFISVL